MASNSGKAGIAASDVYRAAMAGFFMRDEEEEEKDKAPAEEKESAAATLELKGDHEKLSPNQKKVLMMLKEAMLYPCMKLKQINLSFSGASVYFATPLRHDGNPMPASVLKFDNRENVEDEKIKTMKYAQLFGLTTPKVKEVQHLLGVSPEEPASVMQIDLCGGVFGLPQFASAPPVLTFASVLEQELSSEHRKVDMMPVLTEALERRMHDFTMSSRSVKEVNLAAMYKLVRFVGHGVLYRAKEGAERARKSAALAHGFANPKDVDHLDPNGDFMCELTGRRSSAKDFFTTFVTHEPVFAKSFTRKVILGLAHNDLHGGNLLLDTQGLVWLIDFATVKDDVHVLMDLTKFMASCLFLYLQDNVNENHIKLFAKLLAVTPDATTSLPRVGGEEVKQHARATLMWEMLSCIRHSMCIYENGDDAPSNDGTPFSIALFSWSVRMLSFSEPSLHQKTRALYFSLATALRLMHAARLDVGPAAVDWMDQFRTVWEGHKGRRLSASANAVEEAGWQFEVEYPRYLSQVGSSEAWSTDFLTREKVHVTDHCIAVDVKFSGKILPRFVPMTKQTVSLLNALRRIHEAYLPQLLSLERYFGRLIIMGDAGTGKTMLTKRLLSEISQDELKKAHCSKGQTDASDQQLDRTNVVPLRVPLVDLARQLELDPDTSLEADPVNDLLATFLSRKFGPESVHLKIMSEVRGDWLGLQRQLEGASEASETLRAANSHDDAQASSAVRGMLLLLDGYDEAAGMRGKLLHYLKSLLVSEPVHLTILTTRPGSFGSEENDVFSALGFISFQMGLINAEQAQLIAARTLERLQDPKHRIETIVNKIREPTYSSLRTNPLILLLLVHVLRKNTKDAECGPQALVRTSSAEKAVMKKSDLYQQAFRLIVHQSDAAKFMMRDGAADMAMVHRLEMLKSVRARKALQAICWHVHVLEDRAMTWDLMLEAANDDEMIRMMKESFEEGRLPVFEQLEALRDGKVQLQMTHLSFQELLASEYAAAVVRHAHTFGKTEAYVNFILSSSCQNLSRDRLSRHFWTHVVCFICEMLPSSIFKEFIRIMSNDERTKLRVGSSTFRVSLHPMYTLLLKNKPKKPWDAAAVRARVIEYDEESGICKLKGEMDTCLKKMLLRNSLNKLLCRDVAASFVQWPADGVATILRHAARTGQMDLTSELLTNKVHHGCVDDLGYDSFLHAHAVANFEVLAMMSDIAQADWCHHVFCCIVTNLRTLKVDLSPDPRYSEALRLCTCIDQHKRAMKCQALALEKGGGKPQSKAMGPNSVEPHTLMTSLMTAAAEGDVAMVKELLDRKADVTAQCSEGAVALSYAAECQNGSSGTECMRLLISARSDVNHQAGKTYRREFFVVHGRGWPMGIQVCVAKNSDKLDLLLASGYDVNLGNDFNYTAIWFACRSGDVDIVHKLLDAKAELGTARTFQRAGPRDLPYNAIDSLFYDNYNPVIDVFNHGGKGTVAMTKILMDSGLDVNTEMSYGKDTLLSWYIVFISVTPFADDKENQIKYIMDVAGYDICKVMKCGYHTWTFMAFFGVFPVTILTCLDHMGGKELPRQKTLFGSKDVMSLAKMGNNKVFLETYEDWKLAREYQQS